MNTAQRNFLIKKIKDTSDIRIKSLEDSMPEKPNLSNYLLHAVMSGTFEIVSNEKIKELIKAKALTAKQGDSNWLAKVKGYSSAFGNDKDLTFKAYDFFIVPEEYQKLYEQYESEKSRINSEINEICLQVDTLITRIQLSSDKTLQTMINEVDDMGNISLMDTKIKYLQNPDSQKSISQ